MQTRRYLTLEPFATPAEAERFVARLLRPPASPSDVRRNWIAYEADTAIGWFQLTYDPDTRDAFIGYVVFAAYWRRGYGREGVRLTLDEAVALGARNAIAEVESRNVASLALLAGLGFVQTGKRENDPLRGEPSVDIVLERGLR